jgi:cobalt-precorrin 5A hydrolase
MSIAAITLSQEGANLAERLRTKLPDCDVFVHESVEARPTAKRFSSVRDLTTSIFHRVTGIVYIAPCGVAVRSVAPHLGTKTSDPAVVVVDVGARWAISLLSGHEGGANGLAVAVSNILFTEPVISTTTEALKTLIVGIGCRKGVESEHIVAAVRSALESENLSLSEVRLLSTADVKADEAGMAQAARELGIPLKLVSSDEIRNCAFDYQRSDVVERHVDVPAVAEPCALLAGRKTRLVVKRKVFNGVTVAVARESSLS